MTDRILYRYKGENDSTIVSPVEPPQGTLYTTLHRLIADEGKLLKKGDIETPCIDTEDPTGWTEIDDPDYEPPEEEEPTEVE